MTVALLVAAVVAHGSSCSGPITGPSCWRGCPHRDSPSYSIDRVAAGPARGCPSFAERILYTIAGSYTVMVVVSLLLSYLPGADDVADLRRL
ncbi:MAG: hypothetical protein R2932_27805 [Caldilineaceae bacterium]